MLMHAIAADQPRPLVRRFRQQAHAEPDDAVGAELHQHAGVQHGDGGRRRRVAVRRPGMERKDRRENPEADVEREEHPRLQRRIEAHRLRASRNENDVRARRHVERQDADQNERRPEQQVQRQLHRRVFLRADARAAVRPAEDAARRHLTRRSPDADEQIHRQHGDFVEQEEDEEIERHEDAEDAGDEQQQQRVELLVARLDGPRREHAGENDDRRQQHQHDAHAVHAASS